MVDTDYVTGGNTQIEKNYDYGVIGDRNTYVLDIEAVLDREKVPVLDSGLEELDRKLIYTHPSQLPASHGSAFVASYSGKGKKGHKVRNVNDSAQLFVAEEPPFKVENLDFSDLDSFLVGDHRDTFLENETIRIQGLPSISF